MKRKFIQTEFEINHELYFITQQEIILERQVVFKQSSEIIFRPKKKIKMTKRRNDQTEGSISKRSKLIDALQETKLMTAQEKGKWFERKVNKRLKEEGLITTPSSDSYTDKTKGYVITGDAGIDISGQYKERNFVIQCKCHKDPIPASIVREMKGIISSRKDTLGVICAIMFSTNAINEAENSNGRIILTTINNIAEQIKTTLMQNYPIRQISMTYQEAKEIEFTKETIRMREVINGKVILQS
jgi:hypothetical protein